MIGGAIDLVCRGIVSPQQFYHRNDILRPSGQYVNNQKFERIIFQVINQQNKRIEAMILKKKGFDAQDTIIYLHGNGGCKLQATGFANLVLTENVNVICFDFIGCGNSDRGVLTYGIKEAKDIQSVIQHAKQRILIKRLTLWGRSMGALSAIFYCQTKFHKVYSLILDSPFQSLEDTVLNVIKQRTKIPNSLASVFMFIIKSAVEQKVSEKLFNINYLQKFKKFAKNVPVLLFYSNVDETVPSKEVKKYFNACKGERQIIQIPHKHQDDRSQSVLRSGIKWIKKSKQKKQSKIKLSHWHEDVQVQRDSSYCNYCTC